MMRLRNNRGLTLVELLATLVILAIIATIAVLSIGQIIKNTNEKAIIADGVQLFEAVKLAEAEGVPKSNRIPAFGGGPKYDYKDLEPYIPKASSKIESNLGDLEKIEIGIDAQKGNYIVIGDKLNAKITKIKSNSKYYPGPKTDVIGRNMYTEEELKKALEGKGQENRR